MMNICIMSPSPARQARLQRSVGGEPAIRVIGCAPTFPSLRSLIGETSTELALVDCESNVESSVVREWVIELADFVALLKADALHQN
jgi:hypothetical protein